MFIKSFSGPQIGVPFDNSGAPTSFWCYTYKNGGQYSFAGTVGAVYEPVGGKAILHLTLSGSDTDNIGHLVIVVTDGLNWLGEFQAQVVDWDVYNAFNLGLAYLDVNVGSRGTANANDPMELNAAGLAAAANAVLTKANGIETGITLQDALKVCVAVLAGKVVWDGSVADFYNLADSLVRVAMPVAGDGNRGPATLDLG